MSGGFWFWQKNLIGEQSEIRSGDAENPQTLYTKSQTLGDGYSLYGEHDSEHDSEYVKYEGKIIEKADSAEFEYLGAGYAKDDKTVFYKGVELEGADAKQFKRVRVGENVFADQYRLYFYGETLSSEEKQQTLDFLHDHIGGEDLGNSYSRYRNRIFFWDDGGGQAVPEMVLIDVDPETFVSMDNEYCEWDGKESTYDPCARYGKDVNKVFRYWFQVKGADPGTFQVLDGAFAKDKDFIFYDGKKLDGFDSATFQVLGLGQYGKDENNVVYAGRNIVGADPKTFEVLHERYCLAYRNALARDKDNYYAREKRITEEQFHDRLASEKDEIEPIIHTCN